MDEKTLGYSLRLYVPRGAAATRLLDAGLSLKEIAQHMGWPLRSASYMIEKDAAVSPDDTDAILAKLTVAQQTELMPWMPPPDGIECSNVVSLEPR